MFLWKRIAVQDFKTPQFSKSLLSGHRVFNFLCFPIFLIIFFTSISVKTLIIKCHFLSLTDDLNITILIAYWEIWGKELTSNVTASVKDNTSWVNPAQI